MGDAGPTKGTGYRLGVDVGVCHDRLSILFTSLDVRKRVCYSHRHAGNIYRCLCLHARRKNRPNKSSIDES